MDWLSPIRELFGFVFPFLENVPILRAFLGFILMFFLPGFAWTLVFFRGKQINVIERVALSFGLSIAIVILSILALDILVGIRISGFNSVLIIIIVTIIPVVFYYLNKLIRKVV
ncbi:MAG TPA: DUF1616 domain-containing protein [Dehalococcoidales bacterium]|nr:DUF1616 domain-containing protein [Dehalococcoidales bacterium]